MAIVSPNGENWLTIQKDHNVAIYNQTRGLIWESETSHGVTQLPFDQGTTYIRIASTSNACSVGPFQIIASTFSEDSSVWARPERMPKDLKDSVNNALLVLQDDGKAVLSGAGRVLWDSFADNEAKERTKNDTRPRPSVGDDSSWAINWEG